MSKHITKLVQILTISIIFLSSVAIPANAQASLPLSASSQIFLQPGNLQTEDTEVVTFSQLGRGVIKLTGPFDSSAFTFALPANWKLTGGLQLNLSLGVFANSGLNDGAISPVDGGGTLTVELNGETIYVFPLSVINETDEKIITIPIETFESTGADGRVLLRFLLDSSYSCYSYGNLTVNIYPNSYFTLPHQLVLPEVNLANFPQPIYQDSFVEDSALFVIPDDPTSAELQAALTAASGLGNLTGSKLLVDITTVSQLTEEQKSTNHLIYIGKAASLPPLEGYELPLPVINNQFQDPSNDPDDGLIQMINSPSSNAYVVLVVTGNTDQGVIKAAQALSTGSLLSNRSPNLSVVKDVQTETVTAPQPVAQTLFSLGYPGDVFTTRGVSSTTYTFNIPFGWTVTPDASFELIFGHSAIMDYSRSGIVVLLNGKPIGSIRLEDATAANPTNQVSIKIPASATVPGSNVLELRVSLWPLDICTPRSMRDLWVNIWPESVLNLPLTATLVDPTFGLDLSAYPKPYTYSSTLESTAFILMRNDLVTWQAALQIATFMGDSADGAITLLKVFYGDDVITERERENYNFLIIGQPSRVPVVEEINAMLPVPIAGNEDVPSEGDFQVNYRIPSDSPLGYIELMASPWNPENAMLAVLGNTLEGVNWSTLALTDPDLRAQLAGNFAIIKDKQVLTTDTRKTAPVIEGVVLQTPEPGNQLQIEDLMPPPAQKPEWILPALEISAVLFILIVVVILIRGWLLNRVHRKTK